MDNYKTCNLPKAISSFLLLMKSENCYRKENVNLDIHEKLTFQPTVATHGYKHCRFHFNATNATFIGFLQVVELLFSGEGTQCSIQSSLTRKRGE